VLLFLTKSLYFASTRAVYVRLKPPEEDSGGDHAHKKTRDSKRAWNIQKTGALDTLVQKGTARKVEGRTVFHFDQVFDEDAKTPLLYKSIARSMVHTVMDGKHATIFAYGQTGSGYVSIYHYSDISAFRSHPFSVKCLQENVHNARGWESTKWTGRDNSIGYL
jgi:hypothetical protein